MGSPHTEMVFCRVTKDEKLRLSAAAERAGFASVSEWLRVTIKKMLDRVDNVKR